VPVDDGSCAVVPCLGALEFVGRPAAALQEALRVLRPGGLLFISNRRHTRLMPGKIWTRAQLGRLLRSYDVAELCHEPWQVDYERVFARKAGASAWVGARPACELLRCPCCGHKSLRADARASLRCEACGAGAAAGGDGVLDLEALRERCG